MLWYLLYPIRGTTQPPRLSANHPIRRAFYRHGKTTAQHWLVAMLVTVAIAMAFSYPTILLSENPTAGLASYPHHVWTTAKPHDDNPESADVEMRQVWIHGSYMKALDKDVLRRALDIQQTLLGEDSWTSMFTSLRSSTLSWGYHSPLMYWNNSLQMIDADEDVLQTINRQARTTSSSLNVALRPASVFAGKKFDHRKLTAADALVITLMNKVEGSVGNRWQDRMASLTTGTCRNCILFPRDGHVTRNRVYEFSFTPLSAQENIALGIAYGLMALYVLLSLRRLRAFHSRFGLVVTAITQMTCSILASFTICGILKINLSMIPQNAYPFVVLVMGAENMFRIINRVELYPATMATDLRIANALGDVGPVSVATAVQNFVILSLLGRVVSPGVAAFCAFACIATLFDAFFLMTFFVAVLMVDIRRFELQDALARANQSKHKRKPSPVHNHTWFDALVHGRLPFSTRMAGTAVSATFILSLNYHFFEHREQATSLRDLLRLVKDGPPPMTDFDTFAPLPINATLTPGQWMRMQDFDTAREVMRLAKPGADSFIIRIFAPLIVVLGGADRNGVSQEEWTTALRSFAMHHFYPVAVAVVFAVTFVSVLMNFLLYTEHEDEQSGDHDGEEEQSISLRTIFLPHRLDVIKLAGTEKGHILTVGLDRTIGISLYDRTQQSHRTLCLSNELLSQISWPIHKVALEDNGEWAAFHCADDQVVIYSVATGSIVHDSLLYPDDNPPLLFQFKRQSSADASKLQFIILTSGGRSTMLNIDTGESKVDRLTDVPLIGATVVETLGQGKRLLVITERADIISFSWVGGAWFETNRQYLPTYSSITGAAQIEQCPEPATDVLVVTTAREILFLDIHSFTILSSLGTDAGDPSVSTSLLGHPLTCPACGQLAYRCVVLVNDTSSDCVLTILWPGGENKTICTGASTVSCSSFGNAQRTTERLSKPGAWGAIASQAVLGLRKSQANVNHSAGESSSSRLKRRRNTRSRIREGGDENVWQAYKLSLNGELDTIDMPVNDAESELNMALYVNDAGPTVTLDGQSIAVAFGNTVKIIRSLRRDSPGSWVRRPTGRTLLKEEPKQLRAV